MLSVERRKRSDAGRNMKVCASLRHLLFLASMKVHWDIYKKNGCPSRCKNMLQLKAGQECLLHTKVSPFHLRVIMHLRFLVSTALCVSCESLSVMHMNFKPSCIPTYFGPYLQMGPKVDLLVTYLVLHCGVELA